jgi:hypothetical protein
MKKALKEELAHNLRPGQESVKQSARDLMLDDTNEMHPYGVPSG